MPDPTPNVVEDIVDDCEDPGCNVDYGEDELYMRVSEDRTGQSMGEKEREWLEAGWSYEDADNPCFVGGEVGREDRIPRHQWREERYSEGMSRRACASERAASEDSSSQQMQWGVVVGRSG